MTASSASELTSGGDQQLKRWNYCRRWCRRRQSRGGRRSYCLGPRHGLRKKETPTQSPLRTSSSSPRRRRRPRCSALPTRRRTGSRWLKKVHFSLSLMQNCSVFKVFTWRATTTAEIRHGLVTELAPCFHRERLQALIALTSGSDFGSEGIY